MAACGGGGGDNTPTSSRTIIVITPPNGGDPVASDDAAGLLPEEISGNSTRYPLGTLSDNKDQSGEVTYKLVDPNNVSQPYDGDFIIVGKVLYYIGENSGDFESASKREFALKIERTDGDKSPETFDYIIHLQDQTEILSTTAADVDYFSVDENGEGLLDEGTDGSGDGNAKLLLTIDDGIDASGVTYNLTTHTDLFEIIGDKIYYKGGALDYDTLGEADRKFTLNIERIREGITDDDPLIRTINLKNLNDNMPTDLVGNVGETSTEITDYIAVGNVGGDEFAMFLNVGAEDDTLTIKFVRREISDIWNNLRVRPQYDDTNDNTKVTGFEIDVGVLVIDFALGLTEPDPSPLNNPNEDRRQDDADFTVWEEYVRSVTHIGTENPSSATISNYVNSLVAAGTSTLTARPTIEVDEGTTGIIANFASTDEDGDDTLTYSLDEVGDYAAFEINPATGALRFAATPNYATPTDMDGNNVYEITIRVSDGNTEHDKTQSILVGVTKPSAADSVQTASDSAAENIPTAEESAAEATPEAEAAKPSIGRRILEYLFGSQEEHRQMQNQQMDNMFGDTLDPLNPQDPDML